MPTTLSRRIPIALAGLAAALALAACGSSNDSSSTASTAATTASSGSSGGSGAVVDQADNGDLGTILVDGDGRTLYLFEKDQGGKSSCSGACAQEWPPYTTKGDPQAGDGVDASQLSTTNRDDGSTQVVYADHPLYYYAGDASPGDVTGNGLSLFGARWYALDTGGEAVQGGGGSSGGSSSGGGYSY